MWIGIPDGEVDEDEDGEDVGGPTFVFVLGGRNHDSNMAILLGGAAEQLPLMMRCFFCGGGRWFVFVDSWMRRIRYM